MPERESPLKVLSPYLLASAIIVAMGAARWLLSPPLDEQLTLPTFFPAVFFAAWLGGLAPALFATAASTALGVSLFIPPQYPLLALFIIVGVTTAWLGESRLRAQARLEGALREAKEATSRAEEEAERAQEEAARAEEERIRAEDQATRTEQIALQAEAGVVSQKEIEAALRESEERYRAFIEQTAEGVWRFELEQPVSVDLPVDQQIERFYAHAYLAECNDAAAHMYGFHRAAELVGARLAEMMPRTDAHNVEYLRAFVRSGYRLTDAESHEYDRDGHERYFLNNLIGITSDGHVLRAWGSQRDITASRQTEKAIQVSEARFRSVFDSGMIGIAFWNGERMTGANDALLRILGYTREDLDEGLLRHGRLTPAGYEDLDRRATEETRVGGSCTPYEKELLRKDGSRVPVLVGGARLGDDMLDAVFFVLDLTERHRAEERLRHAERIEVVGQLAGGMAHEANNQMSLVLGATSFILARSDIPDAVRQDVEYIKQAAERTASITRQLLAFSRRQILQPQVVNLNTLLIRFQPILRRTLTEQQALAFRLAPDIAPIRADPAQLDQVLLNLAINARDAMPEGGTLTLETRDVVLTDHDIALRPGTPIEPGRYTALMVTDTGHGMDPATVKHLFEPFFTTKAVGKGSGLGLAMVYGIVKQSGGYIWAYSEPSLGTTLKLYFPSIADSVSETVPRPMPAPERRVAGTILVVEDDPLVRGMARRSLVEAGFQVLDAANGREALAVARAEPRLDAVLTDLAMPEFGGRELARRLRETRPGLPIVFMSGYTDDEVKRRGLLDSGVPFLEKPLAPEVLARTMREVLDGAADQQQKMVDGM